MQLAHILCGSSKPHHFLELSIRLGFPSDCSSFLFRFFFCGFFCTTSLSRLSVFVTGFTLLVSSDVSLLSMASRLLADLPERCLNIRSFVSFLNFFHIVEELEHLILLSHSSHPTNHTTQFLNDINVNIVERLKYPIVSI